jgi:hypothetical protein
VECSVKRVEHCTAITRTMAVLLPVMYVRGIEICVVDQQMPSANICLSYIINVLHVSVVIAIIIRVRSPWILYIHVSVEACLCKFIVVLHK